MSEKEEETAAWGDHKLTLRIGSPFDKLRVNGDSIIERPRDIPELRRI